MTTKFLMVVVMAGSTMVAGAAQAQARGDRPDFATLDANGDGTVTQQELVAHREARFAESDTNGDGALSIEELTAASREKAAERAARMLEQRDANGDGLLQQAELAPGSDRMERMFDRIDANDDGAISAEEFEEIKERRGRDRGHGRRDRG